jgi:hypothetical protein
VLFLIPLQFVYLFCNLSKCILLFFSCISSLLYVPHFVKSSKLGLEHAIVSICSMSVLLGVYCVQIMQGAP